MLISILIPLIYYRISTSCQVLQLSVAYVISVIFLLSHQKLSVQIVKKEFAQHAQNITVQPNLPEILQLCQQRSIRNGRRICWKLKNIATSITKSSIYTIKKHECPCCRMCIVENHSDCKNVTIMEKIINNVNTSTMFIEIEHLIKEMIETINIIR